MSAQTKSTSSNLLGRLLAVAIAIVLALAAYWLWQTQVDNRPAEPLQPRTLEEIGTPDAVTECIVDRVGEINALVADGLMSDEAAEISRQRARSLCSQQN
ncbi:hypothetical protein [Oricola cellulosilytica]|uniref:Uncharacterized protein n=1 Tax=Oricola cellulosilytica TaxID=1429082 RepID=A0A4R0P4X0_9HYPH|nr:hypothetical protein [Oricola cellulosilytica]TCD11911.1 hypothetical protein E0D97_16400 [Oricola cellulosilytica]